MELKKEDIFWIPIVEQELLTLPEHMTSPFLKAVTVVNFVFE
jgi:hypothetical protein